MLVDHIPQLLVMIPALPLAAAVIVAVLGKRVLREHSHVPVVLAFAGSCVASLALIFAVQQGGKEHSEHLVRLWTWAAVDSGFGTPAFHVDIVLRADSLTAIMLGMVTFISTLVVIYASGYMHGDPGYWRFFAYVALFVFSMTMLVSVSNFVLLYVFWEAVGLCSYLLIGFWFDKPSAAAAGMKAMLVNRIGDFGFALGVFLIWTTFGTLDFHDSRTVTTVPLDGNVKQTAVYLDPADVANDALGGTVEHGVFGQWRLKNPYAASGTITAICLLLLVGACGKSAQFPLHVWLPDAMEGPTPVSALIHAATMVTAGVYMVARCTPLYHASVDAQEVVATIGGFTALLAALIALTQYDLKRVLAYSTVSQLGYMFLALGTGSQLGVTSGMFHLFTHAFFKALLFWGAGSVMHAMGGVIDMREFGGLKRLMPWTRWTFLIGCLALAGVVPFAGFWSKDEILAAVSDKAAESSGGLYWWLYVSGMLTAFLTAFYTFRAYFLTFHGEERIPKEAGHHAHESPPAMTGPLAILAVGAALVGLYFWMRGDFLGHNGFLMQSPTLSPLIAEGGEKAEPFHWSVAITSTIIALGGIGLAWLFYMSQPSLAEATMNAAKSTGLYALSYGKFFIDEIYDAAIVRPLQGLAWLCSLIDTYLIDGTINLFGLLPRWLGYVFRPLQGGLVPFYALVMALGVLALAGALIAQ